MSRPSYLGIHEGAARAWLALSDALCRLEDDGRSTPCQADPTAFYSDSRSERQEAAEACRNGCPLISLCAAFADANGPERAGVWGGHDYTHPKPRRTQPERNAA